MPRLSIIVPVYKAEKYLSNCIDSILSQTFTDFELILVDDGSPDNSGSICDEYAKRDNRIKVIHKENSGVSDSRNVGIDVASGKIYGFVDSDDDIDPNMYYEMIKYLDENKLDIVCSDAYLIRSNGKKFRPRYLSDKIFKQPEAICEILSGNLDNAVWNKIYRKKVMKGIRYPKERVYEDVATTYKFINNAEKVGYLCKPLYNYYKREGSIIDSSFNSKDRYYCFLGYKERLEFAKNNNLICIEECRNLTLETAISALTAFYANNEDEKSSRSLEVHKFIQENSENHRLKLKQKVLLWSFFNCKILHKFYAKLSAMSKHKK